MKAVVFYERKEGVTREQLMAVYPRHHARVEEWVQAKKVLGIGAFEAAGGSMGIFPDADLAEEFVAGDPFYKEGLVSGYTIKLWNDEYL